jgi:hypothetical protein
MVTSKPAIEVTTEFYGEKLPIEADCDSSKSAVEPRVDSESSKPAIEATTETNVEGGRILWNGWPVALEYT